MMGVRQLRTKNYWRLLVGPGCNPGRRVEPNYVEITILNGNANGNIAQGFQFDLDPNDALELAEMLTRAARALKEEDNR